MTNALPEAAVPAGHQGNRISKVHRSTPEYGAVVGWRRLPRSAPSVPPKGRSRQGLPAIEDALGAVRPVQAGLGIHMCCRSNACRTLPCVHLAFTVPETDRAEWRRQASISNLGRRILDRAANPHIGGASADIAAHRRVVRGIRPRVPVDLKGVPSLNCGPGVAGDDGNEGVAVTNL